MITGTITLLKKKEELHNSNMITLKISVQKNGKDYSEEVRYLDDIDDVKNDYDCQVVRDLLDGLSD